MSKVKTQTIPVPILLTAQKAADELGIGRTKLGALLKAKLIRAKIFNGRRYFITASLLEYVAAQDDANK